MEERTNANGGARAVQFRAWGGFTVIAVLGIVRFANVLLIETGMTSLRLFPKLPISGPTWRMFEFGILVASLLILYWSRRIRFRLTEDGLQYTGFLGTHYFPWQALRRVEVKERPDRILLETSDRSICVAVRFFKRNLPTEIQARARQFAPGCRIESS